MNFEQSSQVTDTDRHRLLTHPAVQNARRIWALLTLAFVAATLIYLGLIYFVLQPVTTEAPPFMWQVILAASLATAAVLVGVVPRIVLTRANPADGIHRASASANAAFIIGLAGAEAIAVAGVAAYMLGAPQQVALIVISATLVALIAAARFLTPPCIDVIHRAILHTERNRP